MLEKMQSSIVRLNNLILTPNLSLCFCTTGVQYTRTRAGRFINKMMAEGTKKKVSNASTRLPSLKGEIDIPKHRTRRTEVLNKLFMKHITDLMATGEVAPELVGRGIDVSQVNITTDLQYVNVYWHSRFDPSFNEATEKILHSSEGLLQHKLSQLRVISIVPPIRFIKDRRLFFLNEIDRRLSEINFDEDFEPTDTVSRKCESVIFTELSPEAKSEIAQFNVANENEEIDDCSVDLPEMRHDVLGLNCSSIMNKIKISLEKVQPKQIMSTPVSKFPENLTAEQFLSNNERRTLFDSFLKQQEIKARLKRKSANYEGDFENNYIYDDNDDIEDDDYFNNEDDYDDYQENYDNDIDDIHNESYNETPDNEDYILENKDR
ncbi:uncharacterized protein LOC122507437 [Leptopilina heterotoma]|uniref:uncharacterized protein LOC122507437 n=1 Tax=Leptopilina heterotoma TaxID=63436 RepID=UPI001CA8FE3B|nr:uncharacterized protein LOC122507437 [Leptopilina heterotoma]